MHVETYSVADDTAGGVAEAGALHQEVEDSSIATSFDGVSIRGDVISIQFLSAISGAEKTTLDGLVSAHTGTPLPDEKDQTTSTSDPGVNDDISQGYLVGSRWINTVSGTEWLCVNNTQGSAVWNSTTVFGSERSVAQSMGVSITTSTTWQNKASLSNISVPAGTYKLTVCYGWNHDATSNDFEARVQQDGVDLGEIHKQESKDSSGTFGGTGTSQRMYVTRRFYPVLTAGSYTWTLDYRTDASGNESSIWDASLELYRIG